MANLVPAASDTSVCPDCFYGSYNGHYGIDYMVGQAVPVYARGNGEVVYAGQSPFSQWAGPNHVIIKYTTADGRYYYQSAYHMSSRSVSVGDCIKANDVIGIAGAMGNAPGGIHLHDELIVCDLDYLFNGGWGPGCYIDPSSVGKGRTIELPPITANPTSVPVTNVPVTPNASNVPITPNVSSEPVTPFPIKPRPIISITPKPGITNPPNAGDNEGVQTNSSAKAYYLDTPTSWDMDSCEKVVTNSDEDIIKGQIDIPQCVNGHSAKNTTIGCSNKWVLAYAETVSVDSFPLLNFLAASNATTEFDGKALENKVQPACYYNITQNLTKDVLAKDKYGNEISGQVVEQEMSFSKDYFGMLKLTSTSGKDVYSNYPKLGTAISCLTLNWADIKYSPILDIQTYNKSLPDVPQDTNLSSSVAGVSTGQVNGWFDSIFGKDGFIASIIDKIKEAVTYKEGSQLGEKYLKNVTNFSLPDGKDSVCSCSSTNKITRVNESDFGEPQAGAKRSVVNQNQEILDLTNTQICDHQYIDGDVVDIYSCQMTGSIGNGRTTVTGSRGATMEGQGYLERKTNCRYDGSELRCDCTKLDYCGREFDCGESIGSLYSQCKSSGLTVVEQVGAVSGSPKYIFSKPGFEKLTIPGMNKALYNAQAALDQINSSYDIKYGENIGIRIPTTREVFDLNSKVLAYAPDKSKGEDYDPDTIKSSLKYFIGYKKTDLNYKFTNYWASKFTKVGDTITVDYYFPYIGKLPYLYERLSAIHSNQNESKTGTTLQNISKPNNSYMYSAQIELCSKLSDSEKLKQDCYTTDVCGDLMTDYLERNDLSFYNCSKSNTTNVNVTTNPTVTPGQIPNGPFSCEVINSEAEARSIIATMVAKYPTKLRNVGFVFQGSNNYCDAYTSSIRCPSSWIGASYMTNRLLFHELMHQSRAGIISGFDTNATSELQASILEYVAVSGNCAGGTYIFKGKDGQERNAQTIASALLSAGASEEDLWNFALGRIDTISKYMNRVVAGGQKFGDLFCRGYGYGVPTVWSSSTAGCSGTNVLGLSTINNAYCPSTSSTGKPSNLACLIKKVADSINSSGEKISAELIWAFSKVESGHNCSKVAGNWLVAAATKMECTGDPNQLALPNPNGSGNILGFTQITNSTYPQAIGYDNAGLLKCFSDLGVVISGEAVDNGLSGYADTSKYTRKTIGPSLCAGAMLYAKYGQESNAGKPLSINEWNLQKKGVNWAVTRYYGADIDGYSGMVKMYMDEAISGNIFASCK